MRICNHCGKELKLNGYVVDNGMEYYCCDQCLNAHYTPEEWAEMYDNGDGDSYWTEWEEEYNDFKNISMNSLLRTVFSIVASYDKLYEEDGNRDRLFMKELIDIILQVDVLTSVYLRDGEIHPDYCLEKLDIMQQQVAAQVRYWNAKKGELNE